MATGNRVILYYITDGGRELAEMICDAMPGAECESFGRDSVKRDWSTASAMVFIMASGIAVRSVGPHLRDKKEDPAILVMDEKGAHVVSLAGGHEAGANDLARELGEITGATPVITTGTDANELTSIDVFAKDNGLLIENRSLLPHISARHIRQTLLKVYNETSLGTDTGIKLADDLPEITSADKADVIISSRLYDTKALILRPKELYLGVGVNSGTSADEIEADAREFLKANGFSALSIACVATHEKKKSEPGLREFAARMGVELKGFTTDELNTVEGVEESAAAMRALGVQAVAEPAALLSSGAKGLEIKKVKHKNVTLALCIARRGTLQVVGTGPGGLEYMTPEAMGVIKKAQVVVGFKPYLDLIEPLLAGKEVVSSAMTQEVDRVKHAAGLALEGRRVALVSGGDPGVYAMAGLAYEVVRAMGDTVDIEVVPGISALNACAARIGAPLMHDFCAVSLSDRLTPWDVIAKRLEAAASADFVIVLYNPKSKGRKTQIESARDIIMKHRGGETPVGIVRSAMREDELVVVTDLERMLEHEIGMRSTVIIGNSNSFISRDRIITPRGYENKYELGQ